MKSKFLWPLLILGGIVFRLIPHEANFVPVGAISLFAGIYAPKKYAWLIVALVMVVSDLILGFHSVIPWVYGSYLLIVLLGILVRKKVNLGTILASSLFASVIFFVVTNFGVWVSGGMYTRDLQGLVECFTLAIPFFRGTLSGDIFYSLVLFTAFSLNQNKDQIFSKL